MLCGSTMFFIFISCSKLDLPSQIHNVHVVSVLPNFKFAVSDNNFKNSITFVRGLGLMKIP